MSGSAENLGGHDFIQANNISFAKRRDDVTEFLDDVIPLDKCIKLLSYEELEAAFMGGVDEDIEDAPEENPKAKAPVEEDDEPPTKKAPVEEKATGECPSGHKYGKDWGECKECDECPTDTYRACRKASRE